VIKHLSLIALGAVLSSCAPSKKELNKPIYTITNTGTYIDYHGGGMMGKVLPEIDAMKSPRKIRGVCNSYCTYALNENKYPDTCVYPQARLTFHAVTWRGKVIYRRGTVDLASVFKPSLRNWYMSKALGGGDYTLTGWDMHEKFNIPFCE